MQNKTATKTATKTVAPAQPAQIAPVAPVAPVAPALINTNPVAPVAQSLVCSVCHKPFYGYIGANGLPIGSTCAKHAGKIGANYKQSPVNFNNTQNPAFIPLSVFCTYAQSLGYSRGFAVRLTGGDGGTYAPKTPHFTCFTVIGGKNVKWVHVQAKTALLAISKNAPIPAFIPVTIGTLTVTA